MTMQEIDSIRLGWDRIADGYDRFVTPTANWRLGEEALRRVDLREGSRFLDVAAGSGALSIPAARRGARVTAVDISPRMIELLQARVRREALDEIEALVMDGHDLDLEDDTFDLSGSQFGVMLFPDLPRALREMVRVTRRGGQVFIVAYGPPAEVEFLTFFLAALRTVIPGFTGLPADPPPLPFQVADPDVLAGRLSAAGLSDVRIESTVEVLELASGVEMWNWVVNSNPIALQLTEGVSAAQRVEVQRVLDGMLRERSGGSPGASLTAPINIGIGVV